MPNEFKFSRKGDAEENPVSFGTIDEEICKHFNAEVHPTKYYRGWMGSFGTLVSEGKSWAEVRESYSAYYSSPGQSIKFYKEHVEPMLDWFEANFTPHAWYVGN